MTPEFDPHGIRNKFGHNDTYESSLHKVSWLGQNFPSLYFYWTSSMGPVRWLFRKAAHNQCDDYAWVHGSAWFGDKMEESGMSIRIEGLRQLAELEGPCVIIANHMSTLETFLLPAIVRPYSPLTFVIKKSLVKIPLFGTVMRSREPVLVGRVNPKEDLLNVFEAASDRLQRGISIVIFPQSTRTVDVNIAKFSSIGVKLAKHVNVPVLPLALKTDAWGNGKKIKELGRIRPDLPVRFKFGNLIHIAGNGKKEHAAICNFICETVNYWQKKDGVNK